MLPPAEVSVMTNVPPLGTSSVSVVNCGHLAPSVIPPQPMLMPPTFSTYASSSYETQTTYLQREVPGAALFAAEFSDLRNMLDKDRAAFELTRQQFEKSIAEREMNLKVGEEKLRAAEQAFKAETTVTVKTIQEAQSLDVRDGIIDGKINGKQIIIEGQGPLVPPPHLMGKRLPPPGMGKGKGGPPPPGKGGKGGPMPPPGKGGKGMPLPPGSPPRFALSGAPQVGSPPGGKGVPLPGKGGKGGPGPMMGRGPPPPGPR